MARIHPTDTVESNFRRILPKLLRRYCRRGRAVVTSEAPNDRLHRFRIRTKRIRYISELYEEAFAGELRGPLQQFRQIQQTLGALQDQCMLCAWLEGRAKQARTTALVAEYRRVLERSQKRQQTLRTAFFRLWKALERSGFEKRLVTRIKKDSK